MAILRAAEPNSQLRRTADRLAATAAVLDEVVRAEAEAVSERDIGLSALVLRSGRVAEYAQLLGERPPATVSVTEYDQLEDATAQLLKLTIGVEGHPQRELHGQYLVSTDRLAATIPADVAQLLSDPAGIAGLAQSLLRQFGLEVPDPVLFDWRALVFSCA